MPTLLKKKKNLICESLSQGMFGNAANGHITIQEAMDTSIAVWLLVNPLAVKIAELYSCIMTHLYLTQQNNLQSLKSRVRTPSIMT